MIHQYQLNGYFIVLDVFSGSVHVVDEMAYEAIALLTAGKTQEAAEQDLTRQFLGRKLDGEIVTEQDIADCFADIQELKEQGRLFTEDVYEGKQFEMKKRSTVVKALCLHVAHTCNLNCEYCFAAQGKFHGKTGLMSYETGKRALDFLIEHSGTRRNL